MAKNTGGKVIQMLSPENYIRKKARSLPIHECTINSHWEESGLANISIARRHTNGNITSCFYLIDLLCLGVKDTHYIFNSSPNEYREQLDAIKEKTTLRHVKYALVHNIILAGIEYAEEFGFAPHKDYTSITQFMLEEDSDDIELMEIECGKDGKPAYVRGPFDSDTKMKQIISRLEKTAGKDNYMIIDEDEEFEDDDEFDEEDEFAGMTLDEKKELFLRLYASLDKHTTEDSQQFFNLIDSIVNNLTDTELYDQYYDEIFEELYMDIDEDEVPDELLGLEPGNRILSEELKNRFFDIYQLINEDLKTAKREFKKLKEEVPEFPGIGFLEIQIIQEEKPSRYGNRLKELVLKYPNYQLMNVLWTTELLSNGKSAPLLSGSSVNMNALYSGRTSIHAIEMYFGLILAIFVVGLELDLNKIEALGSAIYDFDLSETDEEALEYLISVLKINYLLALFTINDK
ncbi:MAG: hypothetical protein AAB347_06465 [Bacteroidota bacterium]